MSEFRWPVRVYYEDTDSGGVVYYANYLKFMERARTEWLRSRGFEQDDLAAREGVIFAVRSVHIDYLKPARFNDQLQVVSTLRQCRRASLEFHQRVERLSAEPGQGGTLCDAVVKIACLDRCSFRPRPLPDALVTEMTLEH